KHSNVKVNTTNQFCDEHAIKSINTKNIVIYRCTDLREWYERHVIEPTLMSLEEFQEQEEYANRKLSYPHYRTVLNLASIEFPMTLKDIFRFECLNDVSVNDIKNKQSRINYLQDPRNDSLSHFAWIKKSVPSREITIHQNGTRNSSAIGLRENERLRYPTVERGQQWLEFRNHCNKERVPFIIYADLCAECVLRRTQPDRENVSSYTYQQHEVFNIGYYVISVFARQLQDLAHRVKNIVFINVLMETLSKEQWEAYCSATHIKEIATAYDENVDVLPITKEKYISFARHVKDTTERAENDVLLLADIFENFHESYVASYLDRTLLYYTLPGFTASTRPTHLPFCSTCDKPSGKARISRNLQLNTNFRTCAKNNFEKNLYKLMNNAIFDNTMENVCVFDISKVCLYEFHQKYMLLLFRNKCKFMYTDTDSLIYRVEYEDVYEIMKRDIARFDRNTRCLNKEIEMTRRQSCIRMIQQRIELKNVNTIENEKNRTYRTFFDVQMDACRKQNFTQQEIHNNVITMLLTASDSISITMNFVIFMLANFPEKVYQELLNIYGTETIKSASIKYDDLQHMHYLDRVIKETLRIFPPAPLIGRQITKDLKIGEVVLPKGADIIIGILKMHRDEEYWSNPMMFDPDRFLPERIKDCHLCYLPFSEGPRNCMGMKYGMMCLKVMIATLVRTFIFKVNKSIEIYQIKLELGVLLSPKKPLKVKIEKRCFQ
ncbi:Cytochrome P450 4C1, partial [Trachymyrmex septentrionalis]